MALIAPFNGPPIVFADATVRPITDAAGRAAFVVAWRDEPAETLTVEGVVGGGFMAGGGTQGFFTRMRDGTVRFLPFDYSRQLGQWFCRSQPDGHWLPITPEKMLASCTDWPPRRTLGAVEGAAGCDQCHGSQVAVTFASDRKTWVTGYASLAINCESCHGPARRHVDLAESGRLGESTDIGVPALGRLGKRESVLICLQCHGEKLALDRTGAVLAPQALEDRYSVLFPTLTDPPYTPDFRHKKFGYQGPHLASACFLDGSMTCTDCHDPHAQHYRDDRWRQLDGRTDDRQCTSCHPSKQDNTPAHTFHVSGSPGSRCVACHMPYLQHPAVGDRVPYRRSDHTVSIPRPDADDQFGIKTACATCHAQETPDALARQVRAWWGELKPRHPLVEAVIRSSDARTPTEGAMLLRPDLDAPMLQFAALTQYFLRFVAVDAAIAPESADRAMRDLAKSHDDDVAALALATLYIADGRRPATKDLVAARIDSQTRLRSRFKLALGYFAWIQQLGGRRDQAIRVQIRAVELMPGDADLLTELGGSLSESGDTPRALALLRESLRLEPDRVLTHMVLGFTRQRAGDLTGAREAYAKAAALNPWDSVPLMRLATVLVELSDRVGAERQLEEVIRLDRSNIQAHVMLARLLEARGDRQAALTRLDKALAFAPANREVVELRQQLQKSR